MDKNDLISALITVVAYVISAVVHKLLDKE